MHTTTQPQTESLEGHTTPRLDFTRVAPEALQAQYGLERYVRSSGLEASLVHLLKLRASILNGCAYCVDMHTKDARHDGETEQRLYGVSVWRETPYFTPRERAALAWTDALTLLADGAPSDALYEQVREQFDEKEMVDLTLAVNAINGWNRLAVGFRAPVGTYRAGGQG
jgi:AhpD family alkylhydroperoxidase